MPGRKLDWEKATRQEKAKKRNRLTGDQRSARRKKVKADRQQALAVFVRKHDIGCFKCGQREAEWAKTGFSKRGPWAVCVVCVTKR